MRIIIGAFLVIFGLGFVAAAAGVLIFGGSMEQIPLGGMDINLSLLIALPFGLVGLATGLIGVILVISGFMQRGKNKAKAEQLLTVGVPARARVTFVDKNYSMLVNEKPIFSIIEFTFTDRYGRIYTGRKTQADSDLVIRNQIVVGSEVDIRYMPENPQENMIILKDPSAM